MALTEIITYDGEPMIFDMARGDVGTLVDEILSAFNEFKLPSTGGEGAVYPAVGDVDLATEYGPTGADYVGTLVQPAIADVKDGVFYGADGTEFEGTLVGGAGETSYTF